MPHDTPVESAFATRLCANRIAELTSQIRTTTARTRPTISPLDGQKIADIAVSSVDDVQSAFDSARAAQTVWAETSLRERRRAVLKLHDFVLEHQDELMDLIQIESGKTRAHAFDESAHVDKAAEGAVGACFSWARPSNGVLTWAACANPVLAAATAPKGSCVTPKRNQSRAKASYRSPVRPSCRPRDMRPS